MEYSDRKTERFASLFPRYLFLPPNAKILVVGCGTGEEAAILLQVLGGEVIGIDMNDRFNPDLAKVPHLVLMKQEATVLPWQEGTFHLVYSYHTLEHIPEYPRVLTEMSRVLIQGGGAVIGTPNRTRIIGYLGSKPGTTWKHKIVYNLIDWKHKLQGRFQNKYGAHAGFSATELKAAIRMHFPHVKNITRDYYHAVYPRKKTLINALFACRLDHALFPSVYFIGLKE